jgi:Cu2+-containing amine oxidase
VSHSIRNAGRSRSLFSSSGEYGMGTMANELSLGCDCLGQIHYLVRSGDQIAEPELNQTHSRVLT